MNIAIVKWKNADGIAWAFKYELECLGHNPICFLYNETIPKGVDVVLSYAPYDRFLPIATQLGGFQSSNRPVFIHWSIENPPDPGIPWPIMKVIGDTRLWVDRLHDSSSLFLRRLVHKFPFSWINNHMHRYRHIGEYFYAYRKGWLDLIFDISDIYVQYYRKHGLPAFYVPWGVSRIWYTDLNLERDIGVLWMGLRRTKHRSDLIDKVYKALSKQGIQMHIADGVINPFIYEEERTQYLNRTVITLNLQYIPYINTLPCRFALAAANRSFVLAETTLPHAPEIVDGQHFISSPEDLIVDKILFYLENPKERQKIVENAYQLVTSKLTMANSLKMILDKVENFR